MGKFEYANEGERAACLVDAPQWVRDSVRQWEYRTSRGLCGTCGGAEMRSDYQCASCHAKDHGAQTMHRRYY